MSFLDDFKWNAQEGYWFSPEGEILYPGDLYHGAEVVDPTPAHIPVGFRRPETLQEQVARLVRNQVSREAQDAGYETFEEAEDFDVDDDFDPSSPFETIFDPVLGEVTPHDLKTFESEYRKKYVGLQRKFFEEETKAADIADKMKALIDGARRSPFVRRPPENPPPRGERRDSADDSQPPADN